MLVSSGPVCIRVPQFLDMKNVFAYRCEEGDLHKMIQDKRQFSIQEKLMMAADVAAGLCAGLLCIAI